MKDYQKFKEELAELCHEQWSGWMIYMFEKGHLNHDGSLRLPHWSVERWTRQMNTPYKNLSEKEKESDREEANKILTILEKERINE